MSFSPAQAAAGVMFCFLFLLLVHVVAAVVLIVGCMGTPGPLLVLGHDGRGGEGSSIVQYSFRLG